MKSFILTIAILLLSQSAYSAGHETDEHEGLNPADAVITLEAYFNRNNLYPALFAKKETLATDGVYGQEFEPITHYFEGSAAYEGLDGFPTLPKLVKDAIDTLNDLKHFAVLKDGGEPKLHVVGTLTKDDVEALVSNGFGMPLKLSKTYTVAFGMTEFEIMCKVEEVQLALACLGAGVETLGVACVAAGVALWWAGCTL